MKSLSLAALQISIVAFLDVVHCQDIQQLRYLLRGRPAFGDQSGLEPWPRQYRYESGNAFGADSDASPSYGGARFGIIPAITPDYTGRTDGVENFGSSETIPYGAIKRISRRKAILIVIRRRRPRSQGGSGSEDDGRWGRHDDDYSSDDQSTNDRRRSGRELLRILLRKLLLAAARRSLESEGSDESQGRDFRSEQPWGRSERGWRSGWRFGEGSDSGPTESYEGRRSRWAREGLGAEGGRILLRIRRPDIGGSSGFYLVGSDRGPQSGPRWISSETAGGPTGAISGGSGEEAGRISDIVGSGAGDGVLSNVGATGTEEQGNPITGMSTIGSGRLAGSRGFGRSSQSFPAQPFTWQGPSSFEHQPNQARYGNEGRPFGSLGSNYYSSSLPRLIFRLPPSHITSGQTGSLGGNNYSGFGGTTETGVSSVGSNDGYSGAFGGLPGGNQIGSSEFSGPYGVSNPAGGSTPSVNPQLTQKS